MRKLDRQMIDVVARAVVSGRRGQGARIDRLADLVAGLMRNRLAASGAPGVLQSRRPPRAGRAAVRPEPRLLDCLIARAGKHLTSAAWGQSGNAGPHSR